MPTDVALANRAWEALMTAHAVLLRQFAAEPVWRDNGLTMREYDVLYTLSKFERDAADRPVGNTAAPAGARIGELQRDVLLSQPALSRMVDRLAERGLVERLEDRTDRRAVCVRLSPAGRDVQRRVGLAHARSVARAVGGSLEGPELHELSRLTTELVERAQRQHPLPSTPEA